MLGLAAASKAISPLKLLVRFFFAARAASLSLATAPAKAALSNILSHLTGGVTSVVEALSKITFNFPHGVLPWGDE
jgi:hypothetical protein